MPSLSPRDQKIVEACLVLDIAGDDIANLCDDALFAEIAGAIGLLPEMTLPERIQHAFEAQRLEIGLPLATEIAKNLYFDGLDPVWDAVAQAA
jgi:hypothetical protein